jgi:TonB family protein
MNFIKPDNKIAPAVCFSLLLHLAVATLLISGVSGSLISPPKLNGINLVWISLNAKSNDHGMVTQNDRLEQPSPAVVRTIPKTANFEKPAYKPEALQTVAATTKELTNSITLTKYALSGQATNEQAKNITGRNGNQTAGDTSNLNAVMAYPLYKENTPPAYPEIARIRGYEGIVLVSAEILPDGRVGNMKIRKSSGYAILDQSAIDAVKPWKFEPAKKSGNPFTVWVELPIKFILHNNSQS